MEFLSFKLNEGRIKEKCGPDVARGPPVTDTALVEWCFKFFFSKNIRNNKIGKNGKKSQN